MRNFVTINESGKVVAVAALGNHVKPAENMIEVDQAEQAYLGMIYESGEFKPGPGPAPREILTRLEFISRFTDAELAAIYTAAKSDIALEIYLDKLRAAEDVTVTDPRTIGGVEALAAGGLIESGRVAEILAPEPVK